MADSTHAAHRGDPDLHAMLLESQRLGFLGDRPVDQVIAHARLFAEALAGTDGEQVLDLGAGGGVPGLVIAADRPTVRLTMLDRRTKRTDFLERMVRRQGWTGRVAIECVDAVEYADRRPGSFDAIVARGFGPPGVTIRLAARLVRPDGRIVISEPPAGDRWPPTLLAELGLDRLELRQAEGRVAVFHVKP